MKTIIILIACLLSFSVYAEKEVKQLPSWTKEQSRTQGGGWIWFPGKGVSKQAHDADLVAKGKALDYLLQECQALHRSIKFHERAVEKKKGQFHVYVRASIKQRECRQSSSASEKEKKTLSSESLKSVYFQYKLAMAKKTIDYSVCNYNNSYCLQKVSLEFQMRNDYVALLYAQYACEKGVEIACDSAKTTADFLIENY